MEKERSEKIWGTYRRSGRLLRGEAPFLPQAGIRGSSKGCELLVGVSKPVADGARDVAVGMGMTPTTCRG